MKNLLVSAVLFGAASLLAPAVLADAPQLYKWTDLQGVVHYSDQPPKQPAADLQTSDLPVFPVPDQAQVDRQQAALLAEAAALRQLTQAQAQADAVARARVAAQRSAAAQAQAEVPVEDGSYSPAPVYVDPAFVPRAYRANLHVFHRASHFVRPARSMPSRPALPVLQRP